MPSGSRICVEAREDGREQATTRRILALGFCLASAGCGLNRPAHVSFDAPAAPVEAYDYVEVTAHVTLPAVSNCFTDASVEGTFQAVTGGRRWRVTGFCDSSDGSVFRIRFTPPAAGEYRYFVDYVEGGFRASSTGTFRATDGHRRGPIRVDGQHPWHFVWEGTGEHYFFNGTTAYWLLGWKDDRVVDQAIERLHRLKVNRIRVTLAGLYGRVLRRARDGRRRMDALHHRVARGAS